MSSSVFTFTPGTTPVLVAIPHAGTALAPGMEARMTDRGRLLSDTDWYMEKLYSGAGDSGSGMIRASYSRYVIDLNRGPDDATLYPGRPKTGLVPELGFDGAPIYLAGQAPDEAEISERRVLFWQPYHDAVTEELARLKAQWGWAVLWDGHSIKTEVPRLFEGKLPDLNFGTNEGGSCASLLIEAVMTVARENGSYSDILNGRFKGGYTTRHYGQPQDGIHAIQLEKAQHIYLADEEAPWPVDAGKTEKVADLIGKMLRRAARWRP
ncbi:N-formylglutamate deformylase [Acetobacter oeni]|uniref:N-formylglutamate deformylase n=1 Tax=Acetobacter oeni TaxID=304077 RepID=A0A511XPG1_9PROT|nr:N-formylglutamate deformylase [Acetobacter oeni]MBB3884620.1 N-formylglutamate amidohydrolase [Acetobacter oeni]NHO20571.1 N-formylglutamate deformylase [Acetobacter oeni]GBR05055.1 N-formylglutamate amidohydrolase [Acetobacter oeni LMG 21952]GEN64841.1 N-formylglutamate deformylase [Acetobacter oeni]